MATEDLSAREVLDLQFTPRHRFATFAPRLGPFGSFFGDRPPVCSENDAFRTRNGDLNLGPESRRRSTGLQRNRFRPSPPASIRNFCSTSVPVWLRFWRRSTGLQRERCVSDPRLGPEFWRRSTGLQRERSLFRPSLGPERKSSFRCRPHGPIHFCPNHTPTWGQLPDPGRRSREDSF